MQAALARYYAMGLYAIERTSASAIDRIAVAAQQLPHADDPVRALVLPRKAGSLQRPFQHGA